MLVADRSDMYPPALCAQSKRKWEHAWIFIIRLNNYIWQYLAAIWLSSWFSIEIGCHLLLTSTESMWTSMQSLWKKKWVMGTEIHRGRRKKRVGELATFALRESCSTFAWHRQVKQTNECANFARCTPQRWVRNSALVNFRAMPNRE